MPKRRLPLPEPTVSHAAFDDPELARIYEDWYSTPYGRVADTVRRETIDALLGRLPSDGRVLEIGCATGRNAAHLAGRGYRVVGVDPAAALLSRAAERVPVALADGRALPFVDGGFDATLVPFVLEFLDDPEVLLREALRVTRGPVVVIALCRPSYLSFRRRIAALRGHELFRHLRRRSVAQWKAIAHAAGADPVEVRRMMFLPPGLAGLLPGVERKLSRGNRPFGGLVALALRR